MPVWFVEFFKDEREMVGELNLFGWQHIAVIALTLAAGLLLYWFRDHLQRWKRKEQLRFWMAGLFLVNMAVFYSIFIVKGIYDWRLHLPFHLCFLTNFVFAYCLLFNNKKLFRIVYYFTWIGPLPSILMPNTPMRADRFLSWHFVISHHLMLLMGLYCLFVLDWRVERRGIGQAFLCGNGLFLFMYIFNALFGTNYIMTTQLPAHVVELLPFLAVLDYPIFWLEVCGIAGILLAYLPVRIHNRNRTPHSLRQPAALVRKSA